MPFLPIGWNQIYLFIILLQEEYSAIQEDWTIYPFIIPLKFACFWSGQIQGGGVASGYGSNIWGNLYIRYIIKRGLNL